MAAGILVAAAVLLGAAMVSQRNERVTLHEVILLGTPPTADQPVSAERVAAFRVVHADVTHTMEIVPEYPVGIHRYSRPGFPIELSYELRDDAGNVIAAGDCHLEKSRRYERYWDAAEATFNPSAPGRYELQLRLRTPGIPGVRVRVVDPQYEEGQRAWGY